MIIKLILKQFAIVFSGATVLSAGVAFGATTLSSSPVNEGDFLWAQDTCVTDVSAYPTSATDVVYVTEETACFDEKDGILIDDEVFAIEYDSAVGYYYISYDGDRWYFVEWNGVVLLTDGENYVEFALAS